MLEALGPDRRDVANVAFQLPKSTSQESRARQLTNAKRSKPAQVNATRENGARNKFRSGNAWGQAAGRNGRRSRRLRGGYRRGQDIILIKDAVTGIRRAAKRGVATPSAAPKRGRRAGAQVGKMRMMCSTSDQKTQMAPVFTRILGTALLLN